MFPRLRLWLGPVFSYSLLDSYSEKSSSWSWSWSWDDDGLGAVGTIGGAAFFPGAAGLGLAGADGPARALVKRSCLSVGSKMVAIWVSRCRQGLL